MDSQALTVTAVAAAVVALVAFVVAAVALRTLRRVRADLQAIGQDGRSTDLVRVAARQNGRIEELAEDVDELAGRVAGITQDVRQSLRHVSVVRYDAFGDMGGRLSFSAAIIDDEGDGVVLSSIHARGESRTYAKGIVGGSSSVALTPEEQQALTVARQGAAGPGRASARKATS